MSNSASKHYTCDDVTYERWLAACEIHVGFIAGVDLDSCGDTLSRDAYDNGVTVAEHVHDALEQAGFPFDDG